MTLTERELQDLKQTAAELRKSMIDVFPHFTAVKRPEVKPEANTLYELLEARRIERVAQLGLPGENDAQNFFLVCFDPRDQSNFFQDLACEVLCLVDYEHDFLAV